MNNFATNFIKIGKKIKKLYIFKVVNISLMDITLTQENLSLRFANNKIADQPMHLRRLISVFVIRFLKSIISKLATGEISIFWLVSLAEETDFSLHLSETTKTGFL